MKVGIVCPYDWSYPGGVRTHILGLAGALPEVSGGEVTAEILAPASRPEPDIWVAGRSLGVPANGSVARICFGPGPSRRLDERLGRGDLDLLHVHEPAIPSVSLLALVAAHVPLVATFHASAHASAGYAAARLPLRRLLDRIDVRIAVSESARELIGSYFPASYRMIPNGIGVARFSQALPDPELESLRPFVLFVGRAEPRKGFDVLIAAMEEVRRRLDVRLVSTTAPDVHRPWVIPLAGVSDGRLPSLYAAADVFCAPSLGGESFGIVLVEAMAAGTPVVCSDLPGYREASQGAAALVATGDVPALARALCAVLTDPERAAALVSRGRSRAAELDWRVLARDVLACYRSAA